MEERGASLWGPTITIAALVLEEIATEDKSRSEMLVSCNISSLDKDSQAIDG